MPEITLQDGDFGADAKVTVGSNDLYLPDPERPGTKTLVPLAEVEEIESGEIDGLRPVKDALAAGAMGILGGPRALADGLAAATRVKDVIFNVRLRDGRGFVAIADAKTYADLRSAHLEARREARAAAFGSDAPSPADDIIAKYLNAGDPSSVETVADVADPAPVEVAHAEVAEPVPAPMPERPSTPPERKAFGRRGSAE